MVRLSSGTRAPMASRLIRARLRSVLALVRIGTCASGAVLCVAGSRLSGVPLESNPTRTLAASASISFLIAFGQTVNDILDKDVDRVDKPHRPLPSGALSTEAARTIAVACAVGALASAAAVGPALMICALGLLGLSWAYSAYWKNTVLLGNLLVATLASLPVVFGAVAAAGMDNLPRSAVATGATVFLFVLAWEVLKTGVDVRGDTVAGLTTVATAYGVRTTALIATGLCLAFVVSALLLATVASNPALYLAVSCLGAVIPTLRCAASLSIRRDTVEDAASAFKILGRAWIPAVLATLLV
jgi:geranylgeranylglycerol-phosphate geranylgeranyltransferase